MEVVRDLASHAVWRASLVALDTQLSIYLSI